MRLRIGVGDAEPAVRGHRARLELPGGQGLGELHVDRGAAVFTRHQIRKPEHGGTEIRPNLDVHPPRRLRVRGSGLFHPHLGRRSRATDALHLGDRIGGAVLLRARESSREDGAVVFPFVSVADLAWIRVLARCKRQPEQAAARLDRRVPAIAEIEFPRIPGVIALYVQHRLVHQCQGHLGRHGVAVHVASDHGQFSVLPGQVTVAVVVQFDVEEVLDRRYGEFVVVDPEAQVVDHRRTEVDVGHEALVDFQLDQPHAITHVDQSMLQQSVGFDREQHVAIRRGNAEHDGKRRTGAHRVAIDEDLYASVVIANVTRLPVADPQGRFRSHGRAVAITAEPAHGVVSLLGNIELETRHAVGAGLHVGVADIFFFVRPVKVAGLDPTPAHDRDAAVDRDRFVIGVACVNLDRDPAPGPVQVVLGFQGGEIAARSDAYPILADDFAARGVGHARLDTVLQVLALPERRLEANPGAAEFVGGQRFLVDGLFAVVPAHRFRRLVLVEPAVRPRRRPAAPQR